MIEVGPLEALKKNGVKVVQGADRPIAVFVHGDRISAVDNRCPHLGFPLHKGSVKDGILTCHWHEARFDLCSGCTFDLWADDAPAFETEVKDGVVFVAERPRREESSERLLTRLREGLEQNISLIQAKSLIAWLSSGRDHREVVRAVALYGATHRESWGAGLTELTALANLVPHLEQETAYLALLQGSRRVARDCAGRPPHRPLAPLDTDDLDAATLERWLRYWTMVRHHDGAERTLLTAVQRSDEVPQLLLPAVTDRPFAAGGHLLDFTNKAFELLDLIGHEHASTLLPGLVEDLVSSRGGEESNAWRHPIDLVPLVDEACRRLPERLARGRARSFTDVLGLSEQLLSDDPHRVLGAVDEAVEAGATPDQLTKALALAAVTRVARFGEANEISDWNQVHHTMTYANALCGAVRRAPTADLLRGVYHGAVSVYLDRFLNMPPAKLPGERGSLDDLPAEAEVLRARFLELLDQRRPVDEAARVVARYVRLGHPISGLIDTLVLAVVREDLGFHPIQMIEAGIAQYRLWEGTAQAETVLVAVARFLAAHCPTQRSLLQTARIALRLHRGERIYDED